MVDQFGISRDEAIGRINNHWRGIEIRGSKDLVYHQGADWWAKTIYYGKESQWWKEPLGLNPLPYSPHKSNTPRGFRRFDRHHILALWRETLQITAGDHYQIKVQKRDSIQSQIERSVRDSEDYPPESSLAFHPIRKNNTIIKVLNQSTIAVTKGLTQASLSPLALNFGSALTPGAGLQKGAIAQEESILISSGLYKCLIGRPPYAAHRASGDPLYTDWSMYSPEVPVFRDGNGNLLARPYRCSFITAFAPNARKALKQDLGRQAEIRRIMKRRIWRVLTVAAVHTESAIVLGAWGCGALGHEPGDVARLFRTALETEFRGVFTHVIFAILDSSRDLRVIKPFYKEIGGIHK
jgi:uncharacterized protein (TIGR02452 family)